MTSGKISPVLVIWLEALAFVLGILLFTYFISGERSSSLIGFTGLALSLFVIVRKVRSPAELFRDLGFGKLNKSGLIYLIISILVGLLFGMWYRKSLNIGLFPVSLAPFVLLASAIGATEELLFRGFLQTRLGKINVILAIAGGAVAHTSYKLILFWSLEADKLINFGSLFIWTLIAGFVLGAIKEGSRNVTYPLVCHVVFDIIVYGDSLIPPWWIWA
jgi:membrane protease YdiL (CAAX protease family)